MPEPSSFTPCGARLKRRAPGTHPYCRRPPVSGRTRCRAHGGASTGPKTPLSPEARARVTAAMVKGRAAWLSRLKAAREHGSITGKLSKGGRPKKSAPPSPFKLPPDAPAIARRAMRALAAADAKLAPLPLYPPGHARAGAPIAADDPAFALLPEPVLIAANLRLALMASHRILGEGCAKLATLDALPDGTPAKDPAQRLKLLRIVQNESHAAVKLALRVAPEALRPKRNATRMLDLVMRLRAGISPAAPHAD